MSEFFHYCLINNAESIHAWISFVVICSKASLTHLGNRRDHLSSVQPYRAGSKAGEITPKDTLKLIRSAAVPRGSLGVL